MSSRLVQHFQYMIQKQTTQTKMEKEEEKRNHIKPNLSLALFDIKNNNFCPIKVL